MEIEDLIDDYNNGNESEWMKYFGDELDVFFKYAHRRGFFDKLDILDEHQNEYLLFLYSIDKSEFYRLITDEYLQDVDMIDGKPYLTTNDKGGNLSKLFCDNRRNDLSRSTVESILNGDNEWGGWNGYDLTDDIYRDVIQELTKANLTRLKEYIVDTLTGIQVGTDTELLESIAETQGTEYATINNDNIDEIVDDEEINSLQNVDLKHMEVKYDKENDVLVYDRKLKDGSGDKMYGLEVCKSLNLPFDFLEAANEIRLKYNPDSRSILSLKQSRYNSKKLVSTCEKCGKNMGTEVHHLQHQADADENGIIQAEDSIFHKNNN